MIFFSVASLMEGFGFMLCVGHFPFALEIPID